LSTGSGKLVGRAEVQLLDYVVAHETVNSASLIDNDVVASADDDTYYGFMDSQAQQSQSQDPYTSDQQRERDEYEINDTDWHEVVFAEVDGSSTAKLALHNDWIKQKGYQVDAFVEMNLPEQGISGPFKITSIKHIIPQKKPVDDDESDGYDYRPVTGLFTHEGSDIWRISFDNGEHLGVTNRHPIFSVTKRDWQFAGELEIGEEVLTKDGGAKVISKEFSQVQEVYNLEVKDYHNFLVNKSGIVVHNTGFCSFIRALYADYSRYHKLEPDDVLRRSGTRGIDDYKVMMRNNDPFIHSDPIYTTTYNGRTYLWDGHHRLKAAKELENEGIDFELQIHDINPDKIRELSGGRFNDINDLINQSIGPNE
jgi:hypothetical protein